MKSGRKFTGQLAWAKLRSLRRKRIERNLILKRGGRSLTQPEQKSNCGEPEEKPSYYKNLEPMHGLESLRDAGEHLCSAEPIISKIERLGNGANVFAKAANTGTWRASLMANRSRCRTLFARVLRTQEAHRARSNHGRQHIG